MSRCTSCGLLLPNNTALCPHHHTSAYYDNWAQSNRVWCDYFHRGIVPQRLSEPERGNDFLTLEELAGSLLEL